MMRWMNVPNCIVLRTRDGDDVGFVLLAVPEGASEGQCVFMIRPRNPALLGTPLVQSLFARKDLGESEVRLSTGTFTRIRVTSKGLPDLTIELAADGSGSWREEEPGVHTGLALIPPAAGRRASAVP
jgi:hypothetical protein